jgi:hypothetical protein
MRHFSPKEENSDDAQENSDENGPSQNSFTVYVEPTSFAENVQIRLCRINLLEEKKTF